MARKKTNLLVHLERADGKIPAVAYLRVSSTGQDVENSTDAQLAYIRRWAEANGYVIVKVFVDKAKTGRIAERPDFQEMIALSETPDCPFAVVLVWRFSRFFRNREQSVVYKNSLKRKGIRVVSINEKTDDTPAGRLLEGVIESIDEYNSELIGDEVRRGIHNLARRGFFIGGRAPAGMIKTPVPDGEKTRFKLAPDPKTAHIIRRIFDLALLDQTTGDIPESLLREGILNPKGKRWPSNRIHDVLTNRHYEGTIVLGEKPDGTHETVCENAHQGIVTPEEFNRVQELLKSRRHDVVHPRQAGSHHLLSKMGKCRQCGAPYNYEHSGNNHIYIVCKTRRDRGIKHCDSPRLPAAAFEAMTLDVVNEDILVRPKIEIAIEELRKNTGLMEDGSLKRHEQIRENIAEIEQRMTMLYFAYESKDIVYAFYSKRNEELRQLKAEAHAELETSQNTLEDSHIILDNPDMVMERADELRTFLNNEAPTRARAWAQHIYEGILGRTWMGYLRVLPAPPHRQSQRRAEEPQSADGR